MKHHAFSAKTLHGNDEFSDERPKVMHIVSVKFLSLLDEDGKESEEIVSVLHYSADPQTAIREVNDMRVEDVYALLRINV